MTKIIMNLRHQAKNMMPMYDIMFKVMAKDRNVCKEKLNDELKAFVEKQINEESQKISESMAKWI